MGKVTVVCDKFKLKFEVDDIYNVYKAVNRINWRLMTTEPYVTMSDFMLEMNVNKNYYNPLMEEWGWRVEKTGLIEIDTELGIIDHQPVLKLRFITEPIGNFREWY